MLAAQVMVEMDFVPGVAEGADAIGNGLDPDRVGVVGQELDGSRVDHRPGRGSGGRIDKFALESIEEPPC